MALTKEQLIRQRAEELGYEGCGIIPIGAMDGYRDKFLERMEKLPESVPFYRNQQRLTEPLVHFPWARSVVVLAMPYGKYRIPEQVKGRIAKTYLTDVRADANTTEYQSSLLMEEYLQELGLRTAGNRKFGVVGLRWAALEAGLGIIRRNNFLYTKSGSWVHLEAWLTDGEMELRQQEVLPPCPKNCTKCQSACPTRSLSAPYVMQPAACISYMTTFGGRELWQEPLRHSFGSCIYGCDLCQDACPMNRNQWKETLDFPGLPEVAELLEPERILELTEDTYREKIQPKFFYLSPEELWKWKINVLNYMRNNYRDGYRNPILQACGSSHDGIRRMAQAVREELQLEA
ncbi:epoxyqueuosine reductase [Paenibacillus mesotrionivorans]|uniref:Epoxyqueuosine reductase n=1 Tax=Paenibacillus mesotrionivorans TaxID=3160968 RepID=A0ACC7NVY5_9BACL